MINIQKSPNIPKVALTLAGWGLLTPIFSGYFNGIILLGWLVWVSFYKEFADASPVERTVSFIARPIHLGILFVILTHLLSGIVGCFSSPYAASFSKTLSPCIHLALKWGVLWFVYFNSMRIIARKGWDPGKTAPWLLLAMAVHFVYCLVQRSTGIDWTHGFSGHLEDNRFAYGVYRISGWQSHPLTMAYNLMLIVAASASLATRAGTGLSPRLRMLWGGMFFFAVSPLLFSGSRFVMLAFPLALGLLEWRRIKSYWWQALIVVLLLASVLWWEGSLKGRFLEFFDPSIPYNVRFSRFAYWQVHFRIFLDHPWVGVTMGGISAALQQYWPKEYASLEILPAHNIFIQTLADSGLIGMIGLVFFILCFWVAVNRARRILGQASGLEWMLVLTVIIGLVQNNLRDSEYLMALWYLSSLLIVRVGIASLGVGPTSDRMEGYPTLSIHKSPHDRQSDQNR